MSGGVEIEGAFALLIFFSRGGNIAAVDDEIGVAGDGHSAGKNLIRIRCQGILTVEDSAVDDHSAVAFGVNRSAMGVAHLCKASQTHTVLYRKLGAISLQIHHRAFPVEIMRTISQSAVAGDRQPIINRQVDQAVAGGRSFKLRVALQNQDLVSAVAQHGVPEHAIFVDGDRVFLVEAGGAIAHQLHILDAGVLHGLLEGLEVGADRRIVIGAGAAVLLLRSCKGHAVVNRAGASIRAGKNSIHAVDGRTIAGKNDISFFRRECYPNNIGISGNKRATGVHGTQSIGAFSRSAVIPLVNGHRIVVISRGRGKHG